MKRRYSLRKFGFLYHGVLSKATIRLTSLSYWFTTGTAIFGLLVSDTVDLSVKRRESKEGSSDHAFVAASPGFPGRWGSSAPFLSDGLLNGS